MAELIVSLRTLAHETRLRIFRLLAEFPEGLCVCEIVDALGVHQYQASRALACLRETGLAQAHREGTWVRYTLGSGSLGIAKLAQVVRDSGTTGQADVARARRRLAFRREGLCVIGYDDPLVRATLLRVEGGGARVSQEGRSRKWLNRK